MFHVGQGNFSDVCLSTLSRFSNLEKLSLYWVPIVGHGFAAMQNKMPALKKLVLRRYVFVPPFVCIGAYLRRNS